MRWNQYSYADLKYGSELIGLGHAPLLNTINLICPNEVAVRKKAPGSQIVAGGIPGDLLRHFLQTKVCIELFAHQTLQIQKNILFTNTSLMYKPLFGLGNECIPTAPQS